MHRRSRGGKDEQESIIRKLCTYQPRCAREKYARKSRCSAVYVGPPLQPSPRLVHSPDTGSTPRQITPSRERGRDRENEGNVEGEKREENEMKRGQKEEEELRLRSLRKQASLSAREEQINSLYDYSASEERPRFALLLPS